MNMNFINVVPVYPENPEITVSEISRQAEEAGISKVALSLSFHPQGTPAYVNADRLVQAFCDIKNGLGDNSGIELGVLFQSFLGHGWSGPVPLTGEPWQNTVRIDGSVSSRICPLDPGFRAYVRDCVRKTVRAGAKFLLVDDDFGLRFRECFCPLHIAEFNAALGTHYTQAEVMEMISSRPWDDPEVKVFSRLRGEAAVNLAKEIRAEIDAVKPGIRCGVCTPGAGAAFTNDTALALSNDRAKPFIRVCNAIYGMQNPLSFNDLMRHTEVVRSQFPSVEEIIDETDTFPHTYYSESAVVFNAHIVQAILCGLRGCKLWMAEYGTNCSQGSQIRYEKIFAKNRPLYEELLNTVQGVRWCGPASPMVRVPFEKGCHPIQCTEWDWKNLEWNTAMLGVFAVPCRNAMAGESDFNTLTAAILPSLSDEQLRTMFRGSLLIDSVAAKELTKRGFAPLMGVRTVEREKFFFTSDRKSGTKDTIWMMWGPDAACLEPLSDAVQIRTSFFNGITRVDKADEVSPSMTFFTNELGGRVVVLGWSPLMEYYKTMRPKRREWLLEALDFLNGGTLEMTVEVPHQVLVRHGILPDGSELAAMLSLNLDPVENIPVRCIRPVEKVLHLTSAGIWETLKFRQENGLCILPVPLHLCEHAIFKFKFK